MDTKETIDKFNEAFGRGDAEAVMALMTDDCVFENTAPAPEGEKFTGQAEVKQFWQKFFAENPAAKFSSEEVFTAGDRGVVRWRYDWDGGHVRGVDIFKVKGGKVSEKLSYVKG